MEARGEENEKEEEGEVTEEIVRDSFVVSNLI